MSKTLLQATNDVLKRIGAIKGNSGELASLTDSQRQIYIDICVQCWNEVIIDLFESSESSMPLEVGSTTITLSTGDRDYTLPTDLVYIKWPLRNTSNGYLIHEYPGGFNGMLDDQLQPSTFTGRPMYGVIRPTDGQLYLDRSPTSNDNGLQYTLYYDKSLIKSLASDTMPFSDDVYTILIPAVSEKIKMERDGQKAEAYVVSEKKYKKYIGRAARMLSMNKQRTSYLRQEHYNNCDPMEE